MRRIFVIFFLLLTGLGPKSSKAYSVDLGGKYGCHEHWAQEAFTQAASFSPPEILAEADEALFNAVEFDTSFIDRNIYALSLVLGVRSVDVGPYSWLDLPAIIEIQNDPEEQVLHCFRSQDQDYEEGAAAAVEACRQAIRHEINLALGGENIPNPAVRETVRYYLNFVGTTTISVSRFYFHLGRALHTLQDSFSHTYRSVDRTGVVEVMNWIEWVTGDLDEVRDGPPHNSQADDCHCERPWGEPTFAAVQQSSTELLSLVNASSDPIVLAEQLLDFFDHWLYYIPGCNSENGYCDSPDPIDLENNPCKGYGCSFWARNPINPVVLLVILLLGIAWAALPSLKRS